MTARSGRKRIEMKSYNYCKNDNSVKLDSRKDLYSVIKEAVVAHYGEENVSLVGNLELSVATGEFTLTDGTMAEVCTNIGLTGKEFRTRRTEKKVFEPYERLIEADNYAMGQREKKEKAEAEKKAKEEKKAKDEAKRKEQEIEDGE